MSNLDRFLSANKERFGTQDGLPGAFHREALFAQAKPGKSVSVVTAHGSRLTGRVVMKFSTHAVLNLGGRHGTPGVADATNCIYVSGATL